MNNGPMASAIISRARLLARIPARLPFPKAKPAIVTAALFGAVLATSQAAVVPAHADEEQLQRQIDLMKRQLDAMQRELKESKKQSAQTRAAPGQPSAAPAQVVTARNGNEIVIPPPAPPPGSVIPTKALPAWFDGIHVSMAGSFIALEGAYRQHSEVADGASDPP